MRALCLMGLAIVTACCAAPALATPGFAQVKSAYTSSEAVLLDRHGEPLSERRIDTTVRRFAWLALEDLSPTMKEALIASEDKRFYEHAGVDWQGFVSAFWDNLRQSRVRGASTLTMQLAGMLDPALEPKGVSRSLSQKWDQAFAAREIERSWSKAQILEGYLNLAQFRGELQGVHAAARGLFGKHPSGLTRDEAIILTVLLRAPNARHAVVAQRACALLKSMDASAECSSIKSEAVLRLSAGYRLAPRVDLAPHLAARLLQARGERVMSTLDAGLQRFALDTLRSHLAELVERNVEDGAVVVLDNASGEVLAWVGSSGDLSAAREVDGASAPRQAGSTLKPFLYGLAIERGWITAASLIEDSPVNFVTATGLYVPQNYERDFKGTVSVRTALAASLNVPAVRMLALTGVEAFHARLRDLGLDTLTEAPDHYGYSLALGGADVRLADLTNAYRALANGGRWSAVSFHLGEKSVIPSRRVMRADAAYIVGDVLADRGARALTFGLENPLASRFWAAVKTGTSKDMRDNWCIGFTERYSVGVWVGNFSGQSMWDVSGVSGAAPVWRDIVHYLHRDQPGRAPRPPTNVTTREIRFDPSLEPARREWFIAGTESHEIRGVQEVAAVVPRIVYPASGTLLATDPDIPATLQRVHFQARPLRPGLTWRLDGKAVADEQAGWMPSPGPHRLTLVDDEMNELDAVTFEVRGARR